MNQNINIEYSVVIPVYNSEESLEELISRLKTVFKDLAKNFEILLVDDNSRDNSWGIIKKLHNDDGRIKGFKLSKNFGQHNALMCGFNHIKGNYIITMDDDLQNPPEEIPKLIIKMGESGVDVVTGTRIKKKESVFKSLGSHFYHYLLRKIFQTPKKLKFSTFNLIKKNVVMSIIEYKGPHPCLVPLILNNTANISSIIVDHEKRKFGKSNYNLGRLINFYNDLVINHSTIPLKIVYLIGVFSIIGSMIGLIYIVINSLLGKFEVLGWASIMSIIILFGGLILFSLGIIGQYISRVLTETTRPNQYIVTEILE